MNSPIKNLTKKEWGLWIGSIFAVIISNLMTGKVDLLTLMAACVGITSLIFVAKGNVWAQILMVLFSILYGIIITWIFYLVLDVWNTPNIVFSTISITTSFLAAALTMLRSSFLMICMVLHVGREEKNK